jgi:hypothetical protein
MARSRTGQERKQAIGLEADETRSACQESVKPRAWLAKIHSGMRGSPLALVKVCSSGLQLLELRQKSSQLHSPSPNSLWCCSAMGIDLCTYKHTTQCVLAIARVKQISVHSGTRNHEIWWRLGPRRPVSSSGRDLLYFHLDNILKLDDLAGTVQIEWVSGKLMISP